MFPQTVHFLVLNKSPLSSSGRGSLPATEPGSLLWFLVQILVFSRLGLLTYTIVPAQWSLLPLSGISILSFVREPFCSLMLVNSYTLGEIGLFLVPKSRSDMWFRTDHLACSPTDQFLNSDEPSWSKETQLWEWFSAPHLRIIEKEKLWFSGLVSELVGLDLEWQGFTPMRRGHCTGKQSPAMSPDGST